MNNELTASREAVARGVLFLDTVRPDWRVRIDLKEFDISDPKCCTLGQVFSHESENDPIYCTGWVRGTYVLEEFEGTHELIEDEEMTYPVAYGFEQDRVDTNYEDLQEAWLEAIGFPDERIHI